jgi:hypothetical protein
MKTKSIFQFRTYYRKKIGCFRIALIAFAVKQFTQLLNIDSMQMDIFG